MTDDQFTYLMAAIGFGFGSLFWSFCIYVVFGWKGANV